MTTTASGQRELAGAATNASLFKTRRCKSAGGAALGQGSGREAQRQAAVILEVLAGARIPAQAATALGVSVPRYYQLEARALQGLVQACEARPRGRAASADRELAVLKREHERLQRELTRQQSLVRLGQRHLGLAPPAPSTKPLPGKKRRRRPVARALAAAKQLLQRAHDVAEEVTTASDT